MNSKADYDDFGVRSENTIEVDILGGPSKRLWLTVIKQAIYDSQNGNSYDRSDARNWLWSEDKGIGSFIWICTNLELVPDKVRYMSQQKPRVIDRRRNNYAGRFAVVGYMNTKPNLVKTMS